MSKKPEARKLKVELGLVQRIAVKVTNWRIRNSRLPKAPVHWGIENFDRLARFVEVPLERIEEKYLLRDLKVDFKQGLSLRSELFGSRLLRFSQLFHLRFVRKH